MQLYCTVIYNDEGHTFDDVITTIIRAADCSREDAIGFATLIDREGRCVVRCAGFQVRILFRDTKSSVRQIPTPKNPRLS